MYIDKIKDVCAFCTPNTNYTIKLTWENECQLDCLLHIS